MALDKQKIVVPLGGPIDQSVDPRLLPNGNVLDTTGFVYNKKGLPEKHPGMTSTANLSAIPGTDAIYALTAGSHDNAAWVGGIADEAFPGYHSRPQGMVLNRTSPSTAIKQEGCLAPVSVRRVGSVMLQEQVRRTATVPMRGDSGFVGNSLVFVYVNTLGQLEARWYDKETNQLTWTEVIDSSGTVTDPCGHPVCTTGGEEFMVVWYRRNSSYADIASVVLRETGASRVYAAPAVYAAGVALDDGWDACGVCSGASAPYSHYSAMAFVHPGNGGAKDHIHAYVVDPDLTLLYSTIIDIGDANGDEHCVLLAVNECFASSTNSRQLVFVWRNGTSGEVKACTRKYDLSAGVDAGILWTLSAGEEVISATVSSEFNFGSANYGARIWVEYQDTTFDPDKRMVRSYLLKCTTGAASITAGDLTIPASLASKAAIRCGSSVVWLCPEMSHLTQTAPALLLCGYYSGNNSTAKTLTVLAKAATDELYNYTDNTIQLRSTFMADSRAGDAYAEYPPYIGSNDSDWPQHSLSFVGEVFTGAYDRTQVFANHLLSIGGSRERAAGWLGVPQSSGKLFALDGGVLCCGTTQYTGCAYPASESWILSATASTSTGSLDADANYYYKVVLRWIDEHGRWHEGAPSPQFYEATAGTENTITLELEGIHGALPLAASGTDGDKGWVYDIYRTKWDGAAASTEFYFVGSVAATMRATYIDLIGDASLGNLLYTTGGVLPNYNPGAIESVCFWNNRLWAIDAEHRDRVWFSKEITPGTYPALTDSFYVTIQDEAAALVPSSSGLFILGANSLWTVLGEGPNNLGLGGYYTPRLIRKDVGCTYKQSVVAVPGGMTFQYLNKIYLLDYSGNTLQVSKNVEDLLQINYTATVNPTLQLRCISSCYEPINQRVYFTFWHPTSATRVLVLNMKTQQWSCLDFATGTSPFWCVYAGEQLYFLGHPRVEICNEQHLDLRTSTVSAWLPATASITSPWISLEGLAGLQRVWEINITGTKAGVATYTALVEIYYDHSSTVEQTAAFVQTSGGTDPIVLRVKPARQKCRAIKVRVSEYSAATSKCFFSPETLELVVGVKNKGIKQWLANDA